MLHYDQTMMQLFLQLLNTQEPREINGLLARIRQVCGRLTPEQRLLCYDAAVRKARQQAVHDAAEQDPSPAARAMLDALEGITIDLEDLVPVDRNTVEALRQQLEDQLEGLKWEKDSLRVGQVIERALGLVRSQPDEALRDWGWYLLRKGLENHVLAIMMERYGQGVSLSLFCALYFANAPGLALQMLRYDPDRGYSFWESAMTDGSALKEQLAVFRDTLDYATAAEVDGGAAQIRKDIICSLLAWLAKEGLREDPAIGDCADALMTVLLHEPGPVALPGLPTRRVANVLTTLCLGAAVDGENCREAAEELCGLLDLCGPLYAPLREFLLFTLVLRLYQALQLTETTMPARLACLFRLLLVISLSPGALTDTGIYKWVAEMAA